MPQKKNATVKCRSSRDATKNIDRKASSSVRHNVKLKKARPIKKIVWPEHTCEKCGQVIKDITLAVSDKCTGRPVHFECVLAFLKNAEELKANEELLYIGNGNFAVLFFDDPRVRRKFKIVKLIEWEERSTKRPWLLEMAKLGSST